jgi:O-succinylbenzoic acid--CoA ligase
VSLSLRAASAEAPDRPALITAERTWSWSELWERVEREARALGSLGNPASPIAFDAPAEESPLIRLLSAIELGRPALPLSPALSPAIRAELVGALDAVDADAPRPAGPPAAALPPVPADDRRPLALVRTSGSSGAPKAVELSRAAFLASAEASAQRLGWVDDDRWLLALPLAHVGGLSVVTRCLAARRPIALGPAGETGEKLLATIEGLGASLVSLVPAMLQRALEARPPAPAPPRLRVALLGGARTPAPLLAEAWRRGLPVVVTYGLTEACSQVATGIPGEPPDPEAGVGPPLPGTELRTVDGRIEIRSPSLMTGYLPEGAWPSPFTEDGWLRTEDLGHLDERGWLHVTGRADGAITSGGVTVLPGEVEAALEAAPQVAEALVFGQPDARWGERAVALVVPAAGIDGDRLVESLRRHVAALPPAQRPHAVALVRQLPRNALGKPDRRAAAKLRLTWRTLRRPG